MSTTPRRPYRAVLHVHPTRHCNLACRHCYSSSGPKERGQLPVEWLVAAIRDAASLGYEVASVSGGEPFLYKELPMLLHAAKAAGLATAVVTNGYVIGRRAYLDVAESIDTLALSIDGTPARHNWLRRDRSAFAVLEAAIHVLRAQARAFGLVFTVSRENWDDIDWVVGFAEDAGARLLQLHPLEGAGRATQELGQAGLTADELVRLYAMAPLLEAASATDLHVHVDAVHVATLRTDPNAFFSSTATEANSLDAPYAPLIIEDDGTLLPYAYGLNRAYSLGSLARTTLRAALAESRANGTAVRVRQLCEQVREAALQRDDAPVLNWHEALVSASHHFH